MTSGKSVSPGRKAEIIKMSNEGYASKSVGIRFEVDYKTVLKIVKQSKECKPPVASSKEEMK